MNVGVGNFQSQHHLGNLLTGKSLLDGILFIIEIIVEFCHFTPLKYKNFMKLSFHFTQKICRSPKKVELAQKVQVAFKFKLCTMKYDNGVIRISTPNMH